MAVTPGPFPWQHYDWWTFPPVVGNVQKMESSRPKIINAPLCLSYVAQQHHSTVSQNRCTRGWMAISNGGSTFHARIMSSKSKVGGWHTISHIRQEETFCCEATTTVKFPSIVKLLLLLQHVCSLATKGCFYSFCTVFSAEIFFLSILCNLLSLYFLFKQLSSVYSI